jgi:hypothetical protein
MANPKTPQDLALASVSGFGGSFAALGLKMGSGPGGAPSVLHGDGTPASGREVDDLRSLIASEPTALMHRPDYFSVLSRPRFQDLRTGYATRPALAGTAFKDVGMPPDRRDFLWSASCARLSGDCNKAAGEESYKKGDYVPPEDLNRIWQGIQSTETDADAYTDEDIKNANAEDQRIAALSHSVFKNGQGAGLLSRLSGLFNGGIGSFFNSAAQGSRTAVAGTSVGAAGAGPDEGTAAARAHGSAGARRGETAVPEAEPVLASAGTPAGRLAAVLGLLSAAALAARLLKRRQAGEP